MSDKILNKNTGRWVLRSGRIGKMILKEEAELDEEIKTLLEIIEARQQEERQLEEDRKQEQLRILRQEEQRQQEEDRQQEQLRILRQQEQQDQQEEDRQREQEEKEEKTRFNLYTGDIQAGLNLVLMGEATPKDLNKLNNLLEEKLISGKYLFEFKLRNGTITTLTLNPENYQELFQNITEGFKESVQSRHGSDSVYQAIQAGIVGMTILDLNDPFTDQPIRNKSGLYFKKLNTSNIDLTRYQIIKPDDTREIINENCLIYALLKFGINITVVGAVKSHFKTGVHVNKQTLYKVGEIIKHNINLYEQGKNNNNSGSCIRKKQYTINPLYPVFNLALYAEHYFLYEEVKITSFALDNYKEIKDIEDFEIISDKYIKNNRTYYKKCKKANFINSLKLVIGLDSQGLFVNSPSMLINKQNENSKINLSLNKQIIEEEQEKHEFKPKPVVKRSIFFCDTETDTTTGQHQPLLIGCIKKQEKNNISNVRIFRRQDNIKLMMLNFLDYVINQSAADEEIILYFHFLKYDMAVLIQELFIIDICEKEGQIYNATIRYKNKMIKFNDSFKLAPMALNKFNSAFGLGEVEKKDYIGYSYYTIENQPLKNKQEEPVSILKYNEHLKPGELEGLINELKENRELFGYDEANNTFKPYKYYEHYLKFDCLTLCEGMKALEKAINTLSLDMELPQISIFDFLTISSLSEYFIGSSGAFEGVYKVSGSVRDYINLGLVGGRVILNKQYEKKVIEEKLIDYDGVALYSSAIYRLCKEKGLAKGKAKIIEDFNKIDSYNYYMVKIQINKINKKQKLAMITFKNNEGLLCFTNELPNNEPLICYVDKYTLEDYKTFHEIEFNFIEGLYWDEGFNRRMGEIIEIIFNFRLKYKKLGNIALSNLCKLILNSSYGKTITSKSYIKKRILDHTNQELFNKHIIQHYYTIKKIERLNDRQSQITYIDYDSSCNMSPVGMAILSYSKRIMNEVFNTATDANINIYYSDTDSMILKYDDLLELEKQFKNKYNRTLRGVGLGCFHPDFEIEGAKGEVYGSQAVFLGKKCYIVKLESTDKKTDYHIRLKGITAEGVADGVKKFENPIKMFEHLINKPLTMTLNPEFKYMAQFVNKRVVTRENGTFKRVLNFNKTI